MWLCCLLWGIIIIINIWTFMPCNCVDLWKYHHHQHLNIYATWLCWSLRKTSIIINNIFTFLLCDCFIYFDEKSSSSTFTRSCLELCCLIWRISIIFTIIIIFNCTFRSSDCVGYSKKLSPLSLFIRICHGIVLVTAKGYVTAKLQHFPVFLAAFSS